MTKRKKRLTVIELTFIETRGENEKTHTLKKLSLYYFLCIRGSSASFGKIDGEFEFNCEMCIYARAVASQQIGY